MEIATNLIDIVLETSSFAERILYNYQMLVYHEVNVKYRIDVRMQ